MASLVLSDAEATPLSPIDEVPEGDEAADPHGSLEQPPPTDPSPPSPRPDTPRPPRTAPPALTLATSTQAETAAVPSPVPVRRTSRSAPRSQADQLTGQPQPDAAASA